MEELFILLLALMIDITLGEFPSSIHPVEWMGRVLSSVLRFAPKRGRLPQLIYGAWIALLTLALFSVSSYFLLFFLKDINSLAYIFVGALLLKSTFSSRGLYKAGSKMKNLLERGKIEEARFEARSLVSRETKKLDKDLLASATIESIAENICDSFIAPLFYFLLLGIPGAIGYRVVNTLDARVGYHGEYEYLGKVSARLDDILNFIPARVSALIIVAASFLLKKEAGKAWKGMLRDHTKTESSNAGWTMGTMAGALGIQLEKIGNYKLGIQGSCLTTTKIGESLKIMGASFLLWCLICFMVEVIGFVY